MENDLSDFRKNYQKKELSTREVSDNPMELFQKWFYEVEAFDANTETNAMTLSTIDLHGVPRNRVVLLKKYTWEGFIFYTNYNSDKGKSIIENPAVCLSFFWHALERQVVIQGSAEKIAENMSDGYFESRPKGSQLGAWASDQSTVVSSRKYLDDQLIKYEKKFQGEVPRPAHWGGFIVKPQRIEFWQGRPNRMHDRIQYSLQENYEWKIERLAP